MIIWNVWKAGLTSPENDYKLSFGIPLLYLTNIVFVDGFPGHGILK